MGWTLSEIFPYEGAMQHQIKSFFVIKAENSVVIYCNSVSVPLNKKAIENIIYLVTAKIL
jgi:hypothetical protein